MIDFRSLDLNAIINIRVHISFLITILRSLINKVDSRQEWMGNVSTEKILRKNQKGYR